MKSFVRKILLLIVFIGFIASAAAVGGYLVLQATLNQQLNLQVVDTLEVQPGSTPGRVLSSLEEQGILDRSAWIRRYWQWQMPDTVLQVGEYRLQPGMDVHDLLALLQSGDVLQRSVTLVDGWNFKQFRQALSAAERLNQTLPDDLGDKALMAELGLEEDHPEGLFFPDTYQYTLGMSDRDILLRAYERMQKVLAEVWTQRAADLPIDTPYEALILASIVERETGVPHERDEIAGVFTRRLQKGMRLQTDPTVIYGMGDAYAGKIRRSDLREATTYNTYVIDGLPPTPIAMPGREALLAAVNPKPGSSLYFVARGDGSHVFSDTLQEHNRAVRQYQLNRAEGYRSSPAPVKPDSSEAQQ
ncbi:MAG: endolytic transglycosylase MltG [Pseudomonas profundi]|uniref:endolytic transglycosylase MltG n=1 Tax=Pseudomonas profundi TaxID=1981513 RepID=UPI003003587F